MKILVTGGTGYLGEHLVKRLEKDGHEVTKFSSKECDLTEHDALFEYLKDKKGYFDRIYHLAAWTQAGDFCLYHSGEQWLINQKINTNVLDYWHFEQPQAKFICMGTSCSYDPELPLIEENYMLGTPIDSLYTYAMTKRMLYAGLLALNKQYGHKYLCVVPSTLYGPDYHFDGRQLHFIFDLIRKIADGKYEGTEVTLWGDGYQKRELIFVEDFINDLLHLSNHADNDLVNIGAGEEHTIREFAKNICDFIEYPFENIKFDTTKYVGAKSKFLSNKKLGSIQPNLKRISLKEGLSKTVKWYLKEILKK